MKNIFKSIFLFNLFFSTLFAAVIINAPKSFIKNDPYIFSIEVSGEDIHFPKIDKIDSFVVEKARQSQSISNINGNITKKLINQYRLYPTKDFEIPSLEVSVDGKIESTKIIKVKQQEIKQTQSDYFSFSLKSSKQELYVGEQVVLTLQFKHRQDVKIVDYSLAPPQFNNFWSKQIEKNRQYKEGDFLVQELDFLLFAQKSGELIIDPTSIDLAILDINVNAYSFFNNSTKNIRVYSNNLKLKVKPLPQAVNLIGNFQIKAHVDKTQISQGEGVNFKIEVNGIGNIDDIQDIKLDIPQSTIYDNKPDIRTSIKDSQYQGSYKKSFSILPTKNITIPSISIRYFEQQTQRIKTIKTASYNITVKEQKQIPSKTMLEKSIQTQPIVQTKVINSSLKENVTFFLLGVLLTILSIGLYFYVINKLRNKKKTEHPLEKRISKSKSKEELLRVLLPYIHEDEIIKEAIFRLEELESKELSSFKKELKLIIKKQNKKV